MDNFNDSLKGKQLILFTDHKPLGETGPFAQQNIEPSADSTTGVQLHYSIKERFKHDSRLPL
jgi:hypothetical protein